MLHHPLRKEADVRPFRVVSVDRRTRTVVAEVAALENKEGLAETQAQRATVVSLAIW